MTRKEAIEIINDIISEGWLGSVFDTDACKMAIEALKQEPCEDAISRQTTVEKLCKLAEFMNEKREGLGSPYVMAALFIQDNKDEFPSVTPKQKIGYWIKHEWAEEVNGCLIPNYECSRCHSWFRDDTNFCPDCGAKMKREDKE